MRRTTRSCTCAVAVTAATAALCACSGGAPKATTRAAVKTAAPAASPSARRTLPIPAGSGTSLLALAGRGSQTTKPFTVSKAWSVSWSYDCTGTSGLTNFQIYPTSSDPNVIVNTINALSAKGRGHTAYAPAGRFYLIVNTTCDWSLRVLQ
jgi:hypothetical protein